MIKPGIMKKSKPAKHVEPMFIVYDRGIKFLEPVNGPVVAFGREDAEKVLTYLSEYFHDCTDKKGHPYKFEIIPVPDNIALEDFIKDLIG